MILRSLMYGYLGSAAAGVAVAMIGVSAGMSEQSVIAVASPAGMVCGLLGISFACRGQVAALVRAAAVRRRR
jgi:hypothetical protein